MWSCVAGFSIGSETLPVIESSYRIRQPEARCSAKAAVVVVALAATVSAIGKSENCLQKGFLMFCNLQKAFNIIRRAPPLSQLVYGCFFVFSTFFIAQVKLGNETALVDAGYASEGKNNVHNAFS